MSSTHIDTSQHNRVIKQKDTDKIVPNEIRITSTGIPRSYITYAVTVLEEKKYDSVVLKAMGSAVNKAVTVAEIVRRRVPDIHQITEITSQEITDDWTPKEDGQENLQTKRNISSISITLSTKQLDTKNVGYQKPLPKEMVVQEEVREFHHEKKEFKPKREEREDREEGDRPTRGRGGFRGRSRGRGNRGGGFRGSRGRGGQSTHDDE